jgi:GT2 family glycosyltransferase
MSNNLPKIFIGFIIYNGSTSKYLPYFLKSLKAQTLENFKILAFNNGDENGDNLKILKEDFPEIEIMGNGSNLGFSVAYNQMITKAVEEKADYFWVTNPDIIYNEDVLTLLVARLENDAELGSVCPKLLRWDFTANKKTDLVDTYGIEMSGSLNFFDVGQGEKDYFDLRYCNILGPSGASGLYRLSALEKVKEDKKYFDENMFMYKEDCDLNYRLFLAEWESACVPEAVGWHDRTASAQGVGDLAVVKNRQQKSQQVRLWSFRNQQIIFWKYWKLQSPAAKFSIVIYELKVLIYALLFERFLLLALWKAWRERDIITRYG